MKEILFAASLVLFLTTSVVAVLAQEAPTVKSGEELFKKKCAVCHAGGGNTINSKKPIHNKALAAQNIKNADDIVKILRNPKPPMLKFDEKSLPDEDAKAIAEYVLTTFK